MSKTDTFTGAGVLKLASEGMIVLTLTLFLPFLVHLLPSWDDSPLGAHLLPIFYAPLGALFLGRVGIAVGVSVLAPWVNHLLTGQPPVPMAVVLCFQLVVFSLLGAAFLKPWMPAFLTGPAAYAGALLASCCLGSLLHLTGNPFPLALPAFAGTLLNALPGLIILALIGWWFSRHRPGAA
ncbi:MAG: hypothetical protein R6V45_02420 [Oceanipulchritudo sp.]